MRKWLLPACCAAALLAGCLPSDTPEDQGDMEQVAALTVSPADGTTFIDTLTVTLATETAEAQIRYTNDGSNPGTSSLLYEGPITIDQTTTIRARAYKDGLIPTQAVGVTYTKEPAELPPVL